MTGERLGVLLVIAIGALAAAVIGAWLVLVLLACGVVSLAARRRVVAAVALPLAASVLGSGLAWTALTAELAVIAAALVGMRQTARAQQRA